MPQSGRYPEVFTLARGCPDLRKCLPWQRGKFSCAYKTDQKS